MYIYENMYKQIPTQTAQQMCCLPVLQGIGIGTGGDGDEAGRWRLRQNH